MKRDQPLNYARAVAILDTPLEFTRRFVVAKNVFSFFSIVDPPAKPVTQTRVSVSPVNDNSADARIVRLSRLGLHHSLHPNAS